MPKIRTLISLVIKKNVKREKKDDVDNVNLSCVVTLLRVRWGWFTRRKRTSVPDGRANRFTDGFLPNQPHELNNNNNNSEHL